MARILYWAQLFWPYVGGVEVLGKRYVLNMCERGHELAVITSQGSLQIPETEFLDGVPIYRLPLDDVLRSRDLVQLNHLLKKVEEIKKRFQPEVVHINFTDPSVFFHWQTQGNSAASTLVALHVALPSNSPEDSLVKTTLRSAQWVTAPSRSIQEEVLCLTPEIRDRCSVIYSSLEAPSIPPTPLGFQPAQLACLGRVTEEKGFDVALRAMVRILQEFPDTTLAIAGDGPARGSLERLAEELGISSAVRFHGWISPEKVAEFMNGVTLVLVPSRWREAFGLVALQAAQLGRPVIASDVGGLPEIVLNEETGLLVPYEDDRALAKAVLRLLRDPQETIKLGNAARGHSKQFEWNDYVDKYEALCQKLVQENQR